MPAAARRTFWQRTLRLTTVLLLAWLALNLLVPWFARDLHDWRPWGRFVGFWLAAQGVMLLYLAIIVIYVVAMDKLEQNCLAEEEATALPNSGSSPDDGRRSA
jgi:putative solute:sodium symporter small subunit